MRGEKRVKGGECGEEKEGETAVEAESPSLTNTLIT